MFQFSPALPTQSVGQDLWGRGVTADLPALHLLPVGVVYTTACEPSGLFYPSEAQGTVPASEIQAEAQLLTSPQACHLFACCGIVRFALGSWDEQLPKGWPIWQSQKRLCSAPRDSSPLPLLRLKIISLLCPCGASCAWTTVLLNCAPPALHNLWDSLQMNDMTLYVT